MLKSISFIFDGFYLWHHILKVFFFYFYLKDISIINNVFSNTFVNVFYP